MYGKWVPDSRHFITVSDFQLHATVWSLTDGAKYIIRNPKLGGAEGFTFSPESDFLAVAERHECKVRSEDWCPAPSLGLTLFAWMQDFIGVYDCASWELVTHFALESYDCAEIVWSPDNTYEAAP